MDVSVIIINYNTYELTIQCIASVQQHTSGLSFEIIVVDNASSQFPEGAFRLQFPNVKLIRSEKNLGFAGGNNLGIAQASGRYILLLNSDAYLTENSIMEVYRYMEANPKAGVTSVKLIFPDKQPQSVAQRFPNERYLLMELLRLQKVYSKSKAGKILLGAFFDHSETVAADWVWGTFFFFRREILEQLPHKKLDEQFFMYCEDMQWCWDIKKLGYEIHYYPHTAVVHLMGGSSGAKQTLMKKHKQQFLERNYSPLRRTLILRLENLLGIN
jgi:GT2 family glycosyltransferase